MKPHKMTAKRRMIGRAAMLVLVLCAMFGAMPFGARHAAADDSYGTVYVHAHACGSFDGIPPTDAESLFASCTLTPYYNDFFITSEGNTTKGLGSNDFMDWTWNGVPNHIFEITGRVQGQYDTPIVYCQNGLEDHGRLMETTSDNNGGHAHPTMAGGYVICDWFALADAPDNTGTVSIDAFACPAEFDAATAGMNDFYQACPYPEDGVGFSAATSAGAIANLTTGDNAQGNVYWPYVVEGAVQINESPFPGYQTARVFCRSNLSGAQSVEFPAGGSITYGLSAGEHLTCDWYDVHAAGAKVTIINHLCPGDAALDKADIYTLAATCNLDMNGVSFALASTGDSRQSFTGGTMASGIVWFDVVPTQTTFLETLPAGFLAPRVLCSGTAPDDAQPGATTEEVVDQSAITRTIRPGETLQCDWFNLPDHGVSQVGTIAVYPVACPADFDLANSSLKSATKHCQTPQDSTTFDLTTPNGVIEQKSGWYKSGETIFFGIPTDQPLSLLAQPLAGYQTGAVFCGQDLLANGQIDGYDRLPVTPDNTIVPVIVPGAQETCHWFLTPDGSNLDVVDGPDADDATPMASDDGDQGDAPTDATDQGDGNGGSGSSFDLADQSTWTGRVEITVRVCPAGFDPASGDLDGSCGENANGIGFGIYSANQWWTQTTGDWADQMVVWDPVPQQDVTIKEDVPAGYATPVVVCDGQPMSVNGDGSIAVSVGDHAVVSCTFYNIPE